MRAAVAITRAIAASPLRVLSREMAEIVDRETGLADCLAALRPFAELLDKAAISEGDADGETFMTSTDPLGIHATPILTVGDLRRAAAVVAAHSAPVPVATPADSP